LSELLRRKVLVLELEVHANGASIWVLAVANATPPPPYCHRYCHRYRHRYRVVFLAPSSGAEWLERSLCVLLVAGLSVGISSLRSVDVFAEQSPTMPRLQQLRVEDSA